MTNQHGIYLNNSAYNIIQENGANNSVYAVVLENSYSNNITKNNANNNDWYGIYLYNSTNNIISGNDFNDNIAGGFANGIYFWNSNNNTIHDNIAKNNKQSGITLVESHNNTINNNIINGSIDFDGIFVSNSHGNRFFNNSIKSNTRHGIFFLASNYSIAYLNNFSNNGNYGINIASNSYNNSNYFNNFTGNIVGNANDDGPGNIWDFQGLGNYWSDYSGGDANSDGKGDTPHNITGTSNSQDKHPLLIFDFKAPVVNILNPLATQMFGNSTPAYTVEVRDDYYLNFSWYTVDGLNVTFFTNNGTIEPSLWSSHADGAVTIDFYANDTFGNFATDQVIVQKDSTPPVLNLNSPSSFALFANNSPQFDITIYENIFNSSWYKIDGIPVNKTFSGNETLITVNQTLWNLAGNGTVLIKFYANDSMGNMGYTEVIIRKDIIAPAMTLFEPYGTPPYKKTAPDYNIFISDANLDKMWYTLNSGGKKFFSIGELTGTIDQTLWDGLNDGEIIVRFYANDTIGNTKFVEITIQKDTTNTGNGTPPPGGISGYNVFFLITLLFGIILLIKNKKLRSINS